MSFVDENGQVRERRVPHPGTYNANPFCAAAGSRCLEIIASEPVNDRADAAASQLKSGLNQIMKNAGISGLAYGLCSLVRVLFGVNYEGSVEFCSLPHEQIAKGLAAPQAGAFRRGMANAGVDTMAGNLFIVSAVHGKREISQTLEAFEKTVGRMKSEGFA
jgi:glutamate-1-semialdehyde 2,1-aminomutase